MMEDTKLTTSYTEQILEDSLAVLSIKGPNFRIFQRLLEKFLLHLLEILLSPEIIEGQKPISPLTMHVRLDSSNYSVTLREIYMEKSQEAYLDIRFQKILRSDTVSNR